MVWQINKNSLFFVQWAGYVCQFRLNWEGSQNNITKKIKEKTKYLCCGRMSKYPDNN